MSPLAVQVFKPSGNSWMDHSQQLAAHMGEVVRIFSQCLGSNDVSQEIQQEMVNVLKTLAQSGHLDSLTQSLSDEAKQNLKNFLV